MDSTRWERLQDLFHQAAGLPRAEQDAYLRSVCAGDENLRSDVAAMLEEDARGASLLDGSLQDAAHTLLDDEAITLRDFGPYRILRVLGEGGMGVVYLAERRDIGGLVAIKILRDGALSPARRRRFATEEAALAQLSHPLIGRIYDAGALADGTPWFVMEYVEGLPITEYARSRELSLYERIRLFRSVCEAVQYAHGQAIIHRDLKPSNILVKADGAVKLLDFGLAKQLGRTEPAERTQTWLRVMTPAYAAPEQMRGERPSTQTDVYSLGVVLYELLAGCRPFDFSQQAPAEAERTIMEKDPDPPSVVAQRMLRAAVPDKRLSHTGRTAWRELDVICLTSLHKDLQRRYRSAEALLRECDHYLKGEPLEARPDTLGYRLGKFFQRHRRAVSATAAVFTIVVALVVFFTVRLARARTAALAEARRTQRIERFMLNLFDAGDQAAGPAEDLRVVALVDRGAKNAQTLNAEPAVQAELYQTLGNIYQKLGKFDQADSLLHSAFKQRKSLYGADSHEAADGLVALALLRIDQAKLDDAERLVRDGLAMNRRHLPANDPAVAKSTFALARVLEERGRYDEAITTLGPVMAIQSKQGESTDLSESVNALAVAHQYIGHFKDAEALNQRALEMDRRLYGELHPRVAEDLINLGEIQAVFRNWTAAEQFYRQALQIEESWHGKEHPDTATCIEGIGNVLAFEGRFDEAAGLLQEALAIQERVYGKAHPQVAIALNLLGSLEMRRGHLDEAEADFQRMAEIDRKVYGENHQLFAVALENLGEVSLKKNKLVEAERYFRDTVRHFRQAFAPGHPYIAIAQLGLGDTLLRERKYKESETELLGAYQILSKQSTPGANLQEDRRLLAKVYDALHQPEQAAKFRAELAAPKDAGH